MTLLPPPRLPFPLSPVDEGLDDDQHDSYFFRHKYLTSLTLGEDKEAEMSQWQKRLEQRAAGNQNAFGLDLASNFARQEAGAHVRTSSEPAVFGEEKAMAAVAESPVDETDTAPSSPPELSYSKSSKSSSSSIRSDSSDEEESTEKGSERDDVSIVEERRASDDSNLRPESRPTLKRPPRSMTSGDTGRAMTSPVDPRLNSLPNGMLRRGFTSPSSPALVSGTHKTSRSPSPTKPFTQNGVSVSPQTLAGATPKLGGSQQSPNLSPNNASFPRRKSWQPTTRKSTKELEAEDIDEEVEVPDFFVLENVPVSPMPGGPRLSQSLSRPQSRSATPSPQRRPSHTNLHSANVPKNAKRPSAPRMLPNGQYGSPRSPRNSRPPTLQHSNTMPIMHHGNFPKQRSKSWAEDLNSEAKQLSAALEAYAERQSFDNRSPLPTSASNSPPEPTFLKERAKTTMFELPQVPTRSSTMIDPLPISKEKEAVLARTRPSWLPPKDPQEEKRHMRQWEQMMARSALNEKKRALKKQELQESQDELRGSIARIWDQHVLPNWDVVLKEPRTRELWWRGVTPRSRGMVWQKAVGNELELSESSFNAALKRANGLLEKIAEMDAEERVKSKEAAWFDAITRDVRTACPNITDPKRREPFQNDLRDVLKAYSLYRSDVGYVYGTHLVAGILCLHLRPADAFVTLANMLNRAIPLAFHVHDTAAMAQTYDLVLSTLNYKYSKLHGHLTSVGLNPEEYLDPIFRCLFAYHLPVETVSRIWDIFVFEGDKVLVRAAVAVLGKLEGKLYGSREEILDLISWQNERGWDLGGEEEFIAAVREAGKVDAKGRSP